MKLKNEKWKTRDYIDVKSNPFPGDDTWIFDYFVSFVTQLSNYLAQNDDWAYLMFLFSSKQVFIIALKNLDLNFYGKIKMNICIK